MGEQDATVQTSVTTVPSHTSGCTSELAQDTEPRQETDPPLEHTLVNLSRGPG